MPEEPLRVRNLKARSIEERALEWKERLRSSQSKKLPLSELYVGEAWTATNSLLESAASAGWNPELWVASAGLGLKRATALSPAYAATFSKGHADSVASTAAEGFEWWREINGRRLSSSIPDLGRSAILVVLSESYANALGSQLNYWHANARQFLLVGGGDREVPRVASNLGLRGRLGGTSTSLNQRIATKWISATDGKTLDSHDLRRNWNTWSRRNLSDYRFEREPLSDQQLMRLIASYRKEHVTISKTRALRMVRDAGFACEQHRFNALFERVTSP